MSNLSETMQTLPPLPQRQHNTPTTSHFSISKQAVNQKTPRMNNSPLPFTRLLNKDHILHQHQRTHPLVWCCAIICLVFCLLIIFLGITTLIIYLVIRPRYPSFDVPNANLNTIYFDSPENFNGDFTVLANFTNPNRKINVKFDYLDVKLYFVDRLIATRALEPFSQRPGESRLEMIHLISSLVYLPPNPAVELQRQVQSNRVTYNIKGTFRVRTKVGIAHFTYWLHTKCQLELTSPPLGVLVAKNCSTKKK